MIHPVITFFLAYCAQSVALCHTATVQISVLLSGLLLKCVITDKVSCTTGVKIRQTKHNLSTPIELKLSIQRAQALGKAHGLKS